MIPNNREHSKIGATIGMAMMIATTAKANIAITSKISIPFSTNLNILGAFLIDKV